MAENEGLTPIDETNLDENNLGEESLEESPEQKAIVNGLLNNNADSDYTRTTKRSIANTNSLDNIFGEMGLDADEIDKKVEEESNPSGEPIKEFDLKSEVLSKAEQLDQQLDADIKKTDEDKDKDMMQFYIDNFTGPAFGETAKDIKRQALGSLFDSAQEMGNFLVDTKRWITQALDETDGVATDDVEPPFFDFADKVIPDPVTDGGRISRSMVKYIAAYGVGYLGGAKLLTNATKLGKHSAALTAEAIFDFTAIDPEEERLANLVDENNFLLGPIAGYLAADPEDSRLEGRFKNMIEGLLVGSGLGALGEAFFRTLKGVKAFRTGRKASKLRSQFEERVKANPEFAERSKQAEKDFFSNDPKVVINESKKGSPEIEINAPVTDLDELVKLVNEASKNPPKRTLDQMAEQGTFKEAYKEADKIVEDAKAEFIPAFKSSRETGTILNGQQVWAGEHIGSLFVDEYDKLIDIIASGNGTLADYARMVEYKEAIHNMGRIVRGDIPETGRALNIRKMNFLPKRKENKLRYLSENVTLGGGKDALDAEARTWVHLRDSVPGLKKKYFDQVKSKPNYNFIDVIYEVWMNGILGSARTLTKAVGSSFFTGTATVIERGMAEAWSRVTKNTTKVAPGETSALVKGYLSTAAGEAIDAMVTLKDIIKLSGRAVNDRAARSLMKSKSKELFNAPANSPFTIIDFEGTKKIIKASNFGYTGVVGDAIDYFGSLVRIPTANLSNLDHSLGMIHSTAERNALIVRQLRDWTNKGFNPEELEKLTEALRNRNFSGLRNSKLAKIARNADANIQKAANDLGQKNKFTNKLEGNFGKVAEGAKGLPVMRWVIPFPRVETNILKYNLERFPLIAPFLDDYKRAIKAGGPQAQLARTKMFLGASVMAVGGGLYSQGILTGDQAASKSARRFDREGKWRPNALFIGGEYIELKDVADPFMQSMIIGARINQFINHTDNEEIENSLYEAGSALTMKMARDFTPEYLTSSAAKLLTAIDGEDQNFVETFAKSIGRGVVPAWIRDIRNIKDPHKRVTKDEEFAPFTELLNEVKNSIPGFSESLPAKVNKFGHEIRNAPGVIRNMMSPFYHSVGVVTEGHQILLDLNMANPIFDETELDLPNADKPLRITWPPRNIDGVDLDEREYWRFVKLSSGKGLNDDLKRRLKRVFKLPSGVELTLENVLIDQHKKNWPLIKHEKNKTNEFKRVMVKSIEAAFNAAAKGQMIRELGDFRDELKKNAVERAKSLDKSIGDDGRPNSSGSGGIKTIEELRKDFNRRLTEQQRNRLL